MAVGPDIFLLAGAQVPQHQLRVFRASCSCDMMHAENAIYAVVREAGGRCAPDATAR